MKKKVLAVAIASALVAPSAFAAEDELGMRYTSAAEGFYGSIRTEFVSNDSADTAGDDIKDTDAGVRDSTTRLGVQGTNDLGGGLEGFYRYEFGVGQDNGDVIETRLRYVGLRGAFGDVRAGSVWDDTYNYTFSKSDKSPNDSGAYAWYFRSNQAIQYNTPDLNGFQGSIRTTIGKNNDNDVDAWALNAQYSVAGFNVSGTYETTADGLAAVSAVTALGADNEVGGDNDNEDTTTMKAADDRGRWAVGMSYGQDNWNVGGWYGEQDTQRSFAPTEVDADDDVPGGFASDDPVETFSIGADVTVDKVILFAVYEQQENSNGGSDSDSNPTDVGIGGADARTNVGVIYKIGSRSRVWIEYVSQELDTKNNEDDYVNIGLRHDF